MKVFKEDYKHFRECKKLAWFLNEKNHLYAKRLLENQEIISFVPLTDTKTSSTLQEQLSFQDLKNYSDDIGEYDSFLDVDSIDSEEDPFYEGESIADGLETGMYAQRYYENKFKCLNFETLNKNNPEPFLQDLNYEVFFEPRFEYEGCVLKCDILKRNGDGWDLIEVKAITWVKEEHMWDLLYQYDLLTKLGIKIKNVLIMHLNRDYVRQGDLDLQELFMWSSTWKRSRDASKEFNLYESMQEEVKEIELTTPYVHVKKIIALSDEQEVRALLTDHYCHLTGLDYCPHIFAYFNPDNTIFQLKGLAKKKKALWYYEHDLMMINDVRLLSFITKSHNHLRQYEVALHSEKIIDFNSKGELLELLKAYELPIHMYDFETMRSAIPKFDNAKVYQQIPFQYSIHVISSLGFDYHHSDHQIKHYEFLADGQSDPRRALAESLVADMKMSQLKGSFIAYNKSFEKGVIRGLAKVLPDLAYDLTFIGENTQDLQDFFQKLKVYKNEFKGSLSIKKTLPAFDETFSYEDLRIKKGDMASEAFRRRVENNIPLELWQKNYYNNMLLYCERDTWGMVVLFWHIIKLLRESI